MATPTDPDDAAAKRAIMEDYFDKADERIAFLQELHAAGHETEALTLCATYIDSFAQWLYWPRVESGRNFVEALGAFESAPLFSLVHPVQVVRAFRAMKGDWPSIAEIVEREFPGPVHELASHVDFKERIVPILDAVQAQRVGENLWRGTLGAVAYYWIRNPSVHGFGTSSSLSFSNTTLAGNPAPSMTLQSLIPPLRAMVAEARRRSANACQWFGNDAIITGA